MAKTQEELNAIVKDVKALNGRLAELTEEELKHVTGGVASGIDETYDDPYSQPGLFCWGSN